MKYVKSYDQWRRSGVFIVNFEHISHLAVSINFEQVNASWKHAHRRLIKTITNTDSRCDSALVRTCWYLGILELHLTFSKN